MDRSNPNDVVNLNGANSTSGTVKVLLAMKDLRPMTASEECNRYIAMCSAMENEKQISCLLSHFEYLPSWVHFPDVERCEWLNSILAQIWPSLNIYAIKVLKSKIEPKINKKLSAYLKDSFKFQITTLGTVPPRVGGIKVYEKNVNRNEIVIDINIFYVGDCDFSFTFMGLTAGIKNFQLRGLIRILLKPLIRTEPFIGGVDVCFLHRPSIEFKLVGVADIPGLGGRIRMMIDDQVSSTMVLPNKIHYSLSKDFNKATFPDVDGVLCVNVIEAKDLVKKDFSVTGQEKSNPYLILNVSDQTFKSAPVKDSSNPEWNFRAEFIVKDLYGELFKIDVFDEDRITEDSSLGSITVNIDLVRQIGEMDTWMQLEGTKSGTIHFSLIFLKLSTNKDDYMPSFISPTFPSTPSSLLVIYIDSANNLVNSQSAHKPNSSTLISVGNKVRASKLVTDSGSPVFEEFFMFLIINPELDKVRIQMIDNKSNNNMGHISFDVVQLLDYDNMQLPEQSFPLSDSPSDSSVRLSMRLRFLKKM